MEAKGKGGTIEKEFIQIATDRSGLILRFAIIMQESSSYLRSMPT